MGSDKMFVVGHAGGIQMCSVNVFAVDSLTKCLQAGLAFKCRVNGFVRHWQQVLPVHADRCGAFWHVRHRLTETAFALARS